MKVQMLISAVDAEEKALAEKMNLQCGAIIVNQCGENAYREFKREGHRIRCYRFAERGVGLSRNNALLRADGDICLFSDEDIVYEDGYVQRIEAAFAARPEADLLLFNVEVAPERATYHTEKETRVRLYNSGRYPTFSIAARVESLRRANLSFSLLFGGGARYGCGEDSLFLRDALRGRLRICALPVQIGREVPRPSTWFAGYTEKYFKDKGVLYRYLYGSLAGLMAARFLLKHRAVMCREIPAAKAWKLLREGIWEGGRR